MLSITKTVDDMKMFNMDRFQALWRVNKESALEYSKECELYWAEYTKTHQKTQTVDIPHDEKPIVEAIEEIKEEVKEEIVEIIPEEVKEEVVQKTELEVKEWLVAILRDNGMKLASTKWGLDTLTKKVADLNLNK